LAEIATTRLTSRYVDSRGAPDGPAPHTVVCVHREPIDLATHLSIEGKTMTVSEATIRNLRSDEAAKDRPITRPFFLVDRPKRPASFLADPWSCTAPHRLPYQQADQNTTSCEGIWALYSRQLRRARRRKSMRLICCVALGVLLAAAPGGLLAQTPSPKKSHRTSDDIMFSNVDGQTRGRPSSAASQPNKGAPHESRGKPVQPPSATASEPSAGSPRVGH